MNFLKRKLLGLIEAAGYAAIPRWRLLTYQQATYLAKLFDFAGVDLVIDVGANAGQYRKFLRNEVGYSGQILSFEPIPALVEEMRSILDTNWQVFGYAIGAREGQAQLNVMAGSQFSSLRAPDHSSTGLFETLNRVEEKLTVVVKTLDALAEEIPLLQSAVSIYLKLDTQGFDLEVLRGAKSLLPRVAALQTEISMRRIYKESPNFAESFSFIQRLDFSPSGVFPNNEGHFPILVEFDGHFVANRLIPITHRPRQQQPADPGTSP